MIRFLLRFIGLSLLALAFIFLIYDGIRSISNGSVLLTTASYVWSAIHEQSLRAFQAFIENYGGAEAWRIGIAPILDQPVSAMAGVLSVILIVFGRKKKPLIGYTR